MKIKCDSMVQFWFKKGVVVVILVQPPSFEFEQPPSDQNRTTTIITMVYVLIHGKRYAFCLKKMIVIKNEDQVCFIQHMKFSSLKTRTWAILVSPDAYEYMCILRFSCLDFDRILLDFFFVFCFFFSCVSLRSASKWHQ
ncbi:hypothetical protein HanRHA438_Chr16g0766631 [Helianthus annuus]|nr:hypothetical protein HanRHA438_Chr16g0766631 [Helianthus annuus]